MEEHRSSPEEDERIGAYRILRLLGRGGMGEVFLARDDRLKRQVAIKRIRRDGGLHPNLRRRLLREARAAASLNHPAIVQIYDLIDDPSGDCLVLEYAEGKTLAALVTGGPLELGLAVRLAREVAEALAAAHAAGIVHRDLKADNVIVTLAQHAKVLDFGLARMQARPTDEVLLTEHGVVLGTYHAMSPEQARGEEADERSDLFSLGILLHEMLAGRSPFRGANPLDSLRRVISDQPPPLATIRPEVPAPLSSLVERLLAKDPAARPQQAAEVAQELAGIATSLQSTVPSGDSVSDLPTGMLTLKSHDLEQPLPRPATVAASTAGMSVLPRWRLAQSAALGVLILALLAGAAFVLNRRSEPTPVRAEPPRPLRVVVPRPEVVGKDERLGLAASGVLSASLGTLVALEGVSAIDPSQVLGTPRSAIQIARSAGADEVLDFRVESAGERGRITMRRIDGAAGSVLKSKTFDLAIEPEDLHVLAEAVSANVKQAFPGKRLRPGAFVGEVRDQDYAAFLDIKQRLDSGKVLPQTELPGLQRIISGSPLFLEARILAAQVLLSRFQSTKEITYRQQALDLLQEPRRWDAENPSLLKTQYEIELAGDEPKIAAATLARLQVLLAGDPQLLAWSADLAEREDRVPEALALRRRAAERFPSWKNLYLVADLEARIGQNEEARAHLNQLLAVSPDNLWALNKLGRIELLSGGLQRAEQIYRRLADQAPQRPVFTNLGLAQFLSGRYDEAIKSFRKALELDPEHVDVTLNLAEAELALGRTRDAEAHFQAVMRTIAKNRTPAGLSPKDSMTQAQCLAHLGRRWEAADITQKALRQNPEDLDVLQSAALVYALVGDRTSALLNVRHALQKGLKPHWFNLPAFASLREDPEFQEVLAEAGGSPAR